MAPSDILGFLSEFRSAAAPPVPVPAIEAAPVRPAAPPVAATATPPLAPAGPAASTPPLAPATPASPATPGTPATPATPAESLAGFLAYRPPAEPAVEPPVTFLGPGLRTAPSEVADPRGGTAAARTAPAPARPAQWPPPVAPPARPALWPPPVAPPAVPMQWPPPVPPPAGPTGAEPFTPPGGQSAGRPPSHPGPAYVPPAPPPGGYPPPDRWATLTVRETNRAAERAPALGAASLLVPPLALVAVVCGFVGWLRALSRRGVPGRGAASLGMALAAFLAPVGLYGWGSAWAHMGRDLTKFGSGSQIKSVPVIAPGGDWRMVTSQLSSVGDTDPGTAGQGTSVTSLPGGYLSGGLPVHIIHTTAQQSVTAWASESEPAGQSTILMLFASPGLAGQVYQQQAQQAGTLGTPTAVPGVPGATAVAMSMNGLQAVSEMARIGPLVLDVTGADRGGGIELRSAVTARLLAQMAAVPSGIAHLDAENGSYGNRHNEVVAALEVLVGVDVFVLLGLLVMTLVGWASDGRRRRESTRAVPPGWYPDPTGRNWARWWTGAGWSATVFRNGRPEKEPVARM